MLTSPIRIPDFSVPGDYVGTSRPAVPIQSEDEIDRVFRPGVRWVLYDPSLGQAVPYTSSPPPWPVFSPGQKIAFVREYSPRSIIGVGAKDSPPTADDLNDLAAAEYTHIVVSFLHFDPGLKLVYNGPGRLVENYNDFWPVLQALRVGDWPKRIMMSLGGYNSGSWAAIQGQEPAAASILATFIAKQGFDGVDINFEGGVNYGPDDPAYLASVGKLAGNLRRSLPQHFVTITPMQHHVRAQLDAIGAAMGSRMQVKDIVSWINVEFDTYHHKDPGNDPNIVNDFQSLLKTLQTNYALSPDQMTAAFGLWGESGFDPNAPQEPAEFAERNRRIMEQAGSAIKALIQLPELKHPDLKIPNFGGAFLWNYRASKIPADLRCDLSVHSALVDGYYAARG